MTIEIHYKYVLGQRCAQARLGPDIEDLIAGAGRTWEEAKEELLRQVRARLNQEETPAPESVEI